MSEIVCNPVIGPFSANMFYLNVQQNRPDPLRILVAYTLPYFLKSVLK